MTGMGRETGLAKDQEQARPRMPGMLNSGDVGAMTAILDVRSRRWRKPSTRKELTGDCRHRYRQDGRSGRNIEGRPHIALRVVPIARWTVGINPGTGVAKYGPAPGGKGAVSVRIERKSVRLGTR